MQHLIVFILLTAILTACAGVSSIGYLTTTATESATSTPTQPFRKQPEPQRPLVSGNVSGVSEETLVTIHVKTLAGWEARTGTMMGNGIWESVVTDAAGVDFIVTADAEEYVTTPISYTIHLEGLTAYLVENGKITDQEASHLDFHFEPR